MDRSSSVYRPLFLVYSCTSTHPTCGPVATVTAVQPVSCGESSNMDQTESSTKHTASATLQARSRVTHNTKTQKHTYRHRTCACRHTHRCKHAQQVEDGRRGFCRIPLTNLLRFRLLPTYLDSLHTHFSDIPPHLREPQVRCTHGAS